jgi:deazaflavin-dependent oxidoreductase (nitroreductase family)
MDPSINHFIRKFNKRFFNRFSRLLSGFKGSPWNLIVHQGRKSGRAYTTPIVTVAAGGYLYAPLPYGEDVDWLLNIMHYGGGMLKKGGEWFEVENPQIVPAADALNLFPERTRKLMQRFRHIQSYARLSRVGYSEQAGRD